MNKTGIGKKYQLEHYRKYLLNRLTASPVIVEFIENCLATEDEGAKHSFHKIMIHNWPLSDDHLFYALSDHFQITFVPIQYSAQKEISAFYTCSLTFVLKIIKLDFMFPFERNMYNIDVLFNDKTSADCFENRVTIEEIVSGVVSARMSDSFELNLSNFCNDTEFKQKQINFYKVSLLSQFKILMLRMGRDTKILNLSYNNLKKMPTDILNFFIKNLVGVNLSYNHIQSLDELQRISSQIEKLWLEGNPLCQVLDSITYVTSLHKRFPRLSELDGVPLNQHGLVFPFFKNFIVSPTRKTRMAVEKFLTLYFTHYDTVGMRKQIHKFYDQNAHMTVSIDCNSEMEEELSVYVRHSRNAAYTSQQLGNSNNKLYSTRAALMTVLVQFPLTVHDFTTFCVDVIHSTNKCLIIVVDGIFKEKISGSVVDRVFQFRRTFVFKLSILNETTVYTIINEMYHLKLANEEQIANSFLKPIRNMNSLALIDPSSEDKEVLYRAFAHLTQLKKHEVMMRLKFHNWDIRNALREFLLDMKKNLISDDRFDMEGISGLSDASSADELD